MKKYIGTKLIEAEKTVRVDGKMQSVDWPVPDGAKVEHGYKVRYADGYESFSPKDVFEKAYMPLEPNKNLRTDAPSISKKMVENFIAEVHVDTLGEKTTVVRAVLANGFEIVESSSCVSAENYDQNLGKDICMEKIVGKVWYLLGFLLQTAVNGVSLPRMVEPVRDLEQEYQEQTEGEQGCGACDSSCCGCDAGEECEDASEGKTDSKDCAPPEDRTWETDCGSYRSKNHSFSTIEKLKEKMVGDVELPKDGKKVFIHITEAESEGVLQSVVIGPPHRVITALEAVLVENAMSSLEEDTPSFLRKLLAEAIIGGIRRKMMSAIDSAEKKEEAK